jgi:hypothetical protein
MGAQMLCNDSKVEIEKTNKNIEIMSQKTN